MQVISIKAGLRLSLLVVGALIAASCGSQPADAPGSGDTDGKPTIVVSTTIWGDVVENIVGDEADIEVLMPIGADAHEFQLSSRQIAAVQSADLVVVNGLGLEQGFLDAIHTAAEDGANVLEIAPLLNPIPFGHEGDLVCDPAVGHAHDDDHDDDHDHGDEVGCDPHVWMDPERVAVAVGLIVDELTALEPSVDWHAQSEPYLASLATTDALVKQQLSVVGADHRRMVTNHEAFGYFADRYDFEILATVIPGGSTLASPSSSAIAALVELMRTEDVHAIFTETSSPDALAQAVGAELGRDVVIVDLYTESLGDPGSGAETLTAMWMLNAVRIAEALGR